MIHAVTPKKYHKYPSSFILKHLNFLDQVIKSHGVYLFNITAYHKFTVLKSLCTQ